MNESSPQWISRSEWKFPLWSTEKIPSMMQSVMNGKWAKKSCDEFLLARKPWEFSRNVNVRWSSRVPKSSRQENGDRWSPKKTEKSHRSWRRSSSGWSKDHRRKPKRAIEVEEEVPLAEVKKTEENRRKQKKEDGNPNRSEHNGVVVATSPR